MVTLLVIAASMTRAKEQYVYTQISREEGLNSTVNCIYKEKDGDVWIGTPTGLYSFDGYTLKNHTGQLFGSHDVYQIHADSTGNLWVLTDRHFIKSVIWNFSAAKVLSNSYRYISFFVRFLVILTFR